MTESSTLVTFITDCKTDVTHAAFHAVLSFVFIVSVLMSVL